MATVGSSAICLALAVWSAASAWASPPWAGLVSFNHVEDDPQKTYALTEQHGPWMIMASSFSGDGAEEQALALVHELRSRYKLEAFTHKMRFDFHDVRGRGVDQFGAPVKMRCQRGSELQETAVLVGNYPTVDDPEAQRTLQKIKRAQPKCLEAGNDKQTNQSLAGWRMAQKQLQAAIHPEKKDLGPMDHAFVTANPLLPKEYFVPNGVDALVLKMNKDVPHSLLDCPGKYTVQVARFTGEVIIDQARIREVQGGKPMESSLADAAQRAHTLTEALRLKGYEAYEFHDRYASLVTVGSFDSVGTPRADGKVEINPKIYLIMKTFGAEQIALPGQATGAMKPKKMGPFEGLGEIYFDIQPIPVQVPKRSIGAAYSRNTLK